MTCDIILINTYDIVLKIVWLKKYNLIINFKKEQLRLRSMTI